ncbi:hypothetical protein [Novipirellula caenicola]|uniref:SLA1 homology domain-containing protein n=1 Tax=Novipirellula caenicola TaxID=1536901 RepID=A0ABP9VZF3_9BACT
MFERDRLLSICLLATCLFAGPTRAETIAVFAAAPADATIVELATVELAQNSDFQILERSRIEQVLSEQQLATMNSHSDSLLLGHLLGVEMFVIWEKGTTNASGRMIVFDGETGIRIEDRELASSDPIEVAHQLAERIRTVAKQYRKIDLSTLPIISLASVRNVDLPPKWQSTSDQYVARLQQSLTQLPSVGLLERSRLRFVLKEDMLPIAKIQARLLSSTETLTLQLSRLDQHTIKVDLLLYQADDPEPKSLVKKLRIDASEADLAKLTNETAESIAELLTQPTTREKNGDSHEVEARNLLREARRHSMMRQPYSAAVRYEAAYVLSDDPEVLVSLARSIHRSLLIESNSFVGTARGQFYRGGKDISADQWRECVELARYLLGLRIKIHQTEQTKPAWPFLDDETRPANMLAIDFTFPYGIGSSVLRVDPDRSPDVFSELRSFYEDAYKTVFTDFANDARRKLSGEALQRFENEISSLELVRLTGDHDRHCLVNWDERFVSTFEKNLKHDRWLKHLYGLRLSIDDLNPSAKTRLLKSLSEVDPAFNPSASLAARYFLLREQRDTQGFVYSDAFQSQVIRLVNDIADQIERVDEQAAIESRDFVTAYVRKLRYQESHQRNTLGRLFDYACSLTPDPDRRREVYSDAYFRLLDHGILCSGVIKNVVAPSHYYYIPEDLALLDRTMEIVAKNRFGLDDQQHASLINVIRDKRARVEKPFSTKDTSIETINMPLAWKHVREITLPQTGRTEPRLLNAQIIGDDVFVLALDVSTRAKLTQVRLYRTSAEEGAEMRQIGTLELSHLKIREEEKERNVRKEVPPFMRTYYGRPFIPDVIVKGEDHVFVTTEGGGILAFPLSGAPAFKIDTSWGLSSNCIQQVLPVGGNLLSWVGEERADANFVSINLQTKQVELLASCQRKDAKTPLDDFPGARCGLMMAQDENRVIIVMDEGYDLESGVYSNRNGVWRYELDANQFSRFPAGGFQSREFRRTAEYEFVVGRYDVDAKERRWRLFKLNEDRWYEIGLVDLPSRTRPIAMTDSVIWWHEQDRRIAYRQNRDTGTINQFRIIPEGHANRLTLQFFPGCDSAILCTAERLWIVTPNN